MTLSEFMKGRKPGPFKPAPFYSVTGDMLTVYFEDEPAFAEQLSPYLTVERALSDKRIVGVKVFGVREMIAEMDKKIASGEDPFLVIG